MKNLTSRRQFLGSAGALFFSGSVVNNQNALAQRYSDSGDEAYWDLVRSQFSFDESKIPMNAANLCPSFRSVSEVISSLTHDIDKDCSFNNRSKFNRFLENSRNIVAAQLNVGKNEIALVRNTSEANNIINNGIDLSQDDEVLIWDQNHPTNNVAWEVRAARKGFLVKKVSTPVKPNDDQELIDVFVSQFTTKTKVLALTHVSNVSGIKLPIKELASAANARGIYVHVDGAQVWGAMPLDLAELGIDSFSASSHKWFMGPKEVGVLYIKQQNIDHFWPNVIAAGWGNQSDTQLEGARKFESLGQRDDAALAGIATTAHQLDLIGLERIEERIVNLSSYLKEGVTRLGLELVTPIESNLSHGVCIVEAPVSERSDITNKLYENYGISGAATGGIRLCPAIYNTMEHVDRAIDALKETMT